MRIVRITNCTTATPLRKWPRLRLWRKKCSGIPRFFKQKTVNLKVEKIEMKKVSIILLRGDDSLSGCRRFTEEEAGYVARKAASDADYCVLPFPEYRIAVFYPIKETQKSQRWEKVRRTASDILHLLQKEKLYEAEVLDEDWADTASVEAFVESLHLSSYSFSEFKTEKKPAFSFHVVSEYMEEGRLRLTERLCAEVNRAKYLVDLPFSALNAVQLAEWAQKGASELGLEVKVWSEEALASSGMGGLLGVNKGSVDKPSFTEIEYRPAAPKNKKPVVLVGKGVVFDAGGMNIKTGNYMEDMKTDMAGAALVIGIMRSLAVLGLPLHVKGLVPATDNRLNGNALVCGDVIRMYDGTTVEITNTDAEGRLLLADAVAYAQKNLDPALIVTMATLTGAASRALGSEGIAAMQEEADAYVPLLQQAGEDTHERLCFFPMWKEYEKELESGVADIKNCGNGAAGMITAAKFIRRFTTAPFVHLDVAGVEYLHRRDAYRGPGATAFGLRLMTEFFRMLAQQEMK